MRQEPVLTFDMSNHIYLIDSAGYVGWKLTVSGKPLGSLQETYINGNDSACFVFNTESQIYFIHSDGRPVAGYPVKLPARATASLTLSELGKNKEPRIFIPLADKKVHAYGLDGKPILNWPEPGLNELISQPVQVLHSGSKDFLFITGKNGQLLVTDKKGKTIMNAVKNMRVSTNNKFYVNRTNRKGLFLTTDPTGKVLYFQESGRTTEVTFNIFTNNHTFLYEDINNDGSCEFIFYDHNKIYIYDRFYKMIYSYVFRREITVPPFIIELPGGEKRIGAVSGSANEIYLFGIKGLIDILPGIRGNTAFTIGSTGADSKA